jgi:putative phosphoribosyl transferase
VVGRVRVRAGGVSLEGELSLPQDARGVVVFAHGSGSGRSSPRNVHVAAVLRRQRFGTLLVDLLTRAEEQAAADRADLRFDIPMLARRLLGVVDWLRGSPDTAGLPIGLFGSSTGTAAALVAASRRPGEIAAVVSRSGRPDLAAPMLGGVRAPTLLIVGGEDRQVQQLNRRAAQRLLAETRVEVVPGAGHLFSEPGALDEAARLAGEWFGRHLAHPPRPRSGHRDVG